MDKYAGEREKWGLFLEELLPFVKNEGKICWTCEREKQFVIEFKRMWKDYKFKDFILSV